MIQGTKNGSCKTTWLVHQQYLSYRTQRQVMFRLCQKHLYEIIVTGRCRVSWSYEIAETGFEIETANLEN